MSKSIITPYFSLHSVKQFIESISETANSIYYVFAGRSFPYEGGDSTLPEIINNNDNVNIKSYENMVFGKKVGITDVAVMVPRHDWVSNTVYARYNSSEDQSEQNFYAVVNASSTYHVFKVLDNNNDTPSLNAPDFSATGADDEYYSTSDGYVWKYMYTIDSSAYQKFATADYIPVVPNANVQSNAVSGAIDVVTVDYKGSNYNTYLSNTFISSDLTIGGNPLLYNIANNASSANSFYNNCLLYIKEGTGVGQVRTILDYSVIGNQKLITIDSGFDTEPGVTSVYEITPSVRFVGDGTGAVARAVINTVSSNSISRVEIIQRGSGYTYATATVVGNTGGISNSAIVTPIIGPKGGHGKNAEAELGGKYVGISVTFANTESNTIPVENDYRNIGLLKDPYFANVALTIATPTGLFAEEEIVVQANSNAVGFVTQVDTTTVRLTNVAGIFVTNEIVTGQTSGATANVVSYAINGETKNFNTFDNRYKYTYTPLSGTFVEDEIVSQSAVEGSGSAYFHSNNASYLYLTNKRNVINTGNTITGQVSSAVATLNTQLPPDIVEGSGEVLYIENVSPITRDVDQSETIKLILKF